MKRLLITLLEVVAMLFAAFGSFLVAVAPPGANGLGMPAGLAAFTVIVIFAVVKLVLATGKPRRPRRMIAGVATLSGVLFVVLGLHYFYQFSTYVFRFPSGNPDAALLVAGEQLTADAQKVVAGNPHLEGDHAALLAMAGVPDMHLIWPRQSVVQKQTELTVIYVLMVSALALCLGFAIEGFARAPAARRGGGGPATASPVAGPNKSPSREPQPTDPSPTRSTPRR